MLSYIRRKKRLVEVIEFEITVITQENIGVLHIISVT